MPFSPISIERVLHLVELEGLDDRFDLLHLLGYPARQHRCRRSGQPGRDLMEAAFMPEYPHSTVCEFGAESDLQIRLIVRRMGNKVHQNGPPERAIR